MRVLLSAFVCQPGAGSERGIAWAWATALAEQHEVVALTDTSYRDDIEAALEQRAHPNLRFHYVGAGLRGRTGLDRIRYYHRWQHLALDAARELHAARPFDVAHHLTFGSHRLPSHLWRLGVPFIWGPVGGGENVPLRFSHPRWMGSREALREAVRSLSNATVRFDPRIRRTVRHAAVVAATTDETQRSLPRVGTAHRVVVQAAVVPRDEREQLARNRAAPAPPGGMRVMFAGRLLGWKGLGLAVAGFAGYARDYPDAHLDIYGDGRAQGWLRGRVDALGLRDRVTLHGRVPREQLLASYPEHHAFLFPSYHDSGGFVTLEAQASGLPVICLDAGGPGAIVPATAGVKIVPTEPNEVVEAITRGLIRLTEPAAWAAASAAARAHALDPTATPTVESRIASLYDLVTPR